MSRFSNFDYVELMGETLDTQIPFGTRGYILDIFPGNRYDVEFEDKNGEVLDLATVHESNLRLIRRYVPPKDIDVPITVHERRMER